MIGVIDSGTGGVNVIKECMKFYKEDYVFLVDNLNAPYGDKEKEDLIKITLNNIDLLVKKYKVDLIILACNTISSLIDYKNLMSIKTPILKTIPNIKESLEYNNHVLLFATKNTIKYSNNVKYYMNNYNIEMLKIKNLPKLIDQSINTKIKNYEKINKNILKILKKTLFFNNNLKNKYKNIKIIVLGCTHFKHIKNELNEIWGHDVKIIECETSVANKSKWLARKNDKAKNDVSLVLTMEDAVLEKSIRQLLNLT